MTTRALLVGAYERDNFGDLLFLLQTERYLQEVGVEVVAGAPFAADMTVGLGRHVAAVHPLLREERFDHIWTVGGEVGGTTLADAYRMSAPERDAERLGRASASERASMVRSASGAPASEPAYMPRPTRYPRNATASLVINSVGVSGIGTIAPRAQEPFMAALQEADVVVVRDRRSAAFLAERRVEHELAPDLIHSLALTRPRRHSGRGDVVLLQAAEHWIATVGADRLAAAIVDSPELRASRIRMFLAGTAPRHDSVAAYAEVVRRVRALAPRLDIDLLTASREPWELVDHIAAARLWIGLSLHGRIVSAAYGVPRISFHDPKLNGYAETWDAAMPFGTTPRSLASAVRAALSDDAAVGDAQVGERLGSLADASIRSALQRVLLTPAASRVESRFAAAERYRRLQLQARESSVGWRAVEGATAALRGAERRARHRARALRLRGRS